jgi:hypothetical protein
MRLSRGAGRRVAVLAVAGPTAKVEVRDDLLPANAQNGQEDSTTMKKKGETPGGVYKDGQTPAAWLRSAEQLAHAAEIILKDQQAREVPFFRATDDAGKVAVSRAIMADDGKATVEIVCEAPNYVPAELLYAFAVENVIKGILAHRNPGLANEVRIGKPMRTHQLMELANEAGVEFFPQEIAVAEALSHIAEWVGRYPVAAAIDKYVGKVPLGVNPDSLLDWGSQHPIMKRLYSRLHDELVSMLPSTLKRSFGSVTAFRPKIA